MDDMTPIPVSVCMITYNHEQFIARAIDSILYQSFPHFELIIVNDGSSDKTDKIIRRYADPRIRYFLQPNQGPGTAFNHAIRMASGKYVALMSGDDICHPDRLAVQHTHAEKNGVKILFSEADFIDSQDTVLDNQALDHLINQLKFTSQSDVIHQFFFNGNYLCAGTCMVLRDILLEKGMFNPALIQLQDYDLWYKIALDSPLLVLPEKLLRYRIRSDQGNLSHVVNQSRNMFEYVEVHRMMLKKISLPVFKESFKNELIRPDFNDEISFAFEKAFLFLKHRLVFVQYIGLQELYALMQNESTIKHAIEYYDFSLPKLYSLILEHKWLPEFYGMNLKQYIYSKLRAKLTRIIRKIMSPFSALLGANIR